jgi:hypothetical protein
MQLSKKLSSATRHLVSRIRTWFKRHERTLPIIGAITLAITYVSKEIVQSNLESRTRRIDSFLTEARLREHIDALRPDLREELSRGTDPSHKLASMNAEIFLQKGAAGGPVPFPILIDIECADDFGCRAAQLFRHRTAVYARLRASDDFARQVGEPTSSQAAELSSRQANEERALQQLLKQSISDGNLLKPTAEAVASYTGALVSLESAADQRDRVLQSSGSAKIESLNGWLTGASVGSAFFYFVGWTLSLFGLLYGPAGAGAKRD